MRVLCVLGVLLLVGCGLGIDYPSEPACYYEVYGVDGGCNMPVNYPVVVTPKGENR